MCTLIRVLGIIFLARMVLRAFMWRRFGGCGHFGGPFGRGGMRRRMRAWKQWHDWHHHGPIDLGDLGEANDRDWHHDLAHDRPRSGGMRNPGSVGQRVDAILGKLELNGRQPAEAADSIAVVQNAIGPARYPHAEQVLVALRAVAKAPFDVDLAEAAMGPVVAASAAREAVDALEHLHNILTEEQRAELARLTARNAA